MQMIARRFGLFCYAIMRSSGEGLGGTDFFDE